MYRMAMMVLALGPVDDCDMVKVLKMCLVHDLAETRIGDITPDDGVSADDKHRMEREAMADLTSLLTESVGKALMDLYLEYEKHESAEAKLTKDLDIFDFVHQAFAYEKRAAANGTPVKSLNFDKFFQTADNIIHPMVRRLADRLMSERVTFLQQEAAQVNGQL